MLGYNKDLEEQQKIFESIIKKSSIIMKILKELQEYALVNPSFKNYYLAAGCVNQTIFNYLEGNKLDFGIQDYDIVYYDKDTSYEAEDKIIKDLEKRLGKGCYDIKNQARVHIWYNEKYDTKKTPIASVEEAITKWGATVTCVGIRLENDVFKIFAPYGLNDIFGEMIRPVKIEFTKEHFYERAERWKKKWPNLKIISWEDE